MRGQPLLVSDISMTSLPQGKGGGVAGPGVEGSGAAVELPSRAPGGGTGDREVQRGCGHPLRVSPEPHPQQTGPHTITPSHHHPTHTLTQLTPSQLLYTLLDVVLLEILPELNDDKLHST